MKKLTLSTLAVLALLAFANPVMAEEVKVPAPAPTTAKPAAEPTYLERIQKKYNLTDAELKSLSDSKLPDSQLTKVAQLSKSSGKSIDDVLKMRIDEKMGWGRIAKKLGVHPGELGHAESEMKKDRKDHDGDDKDDNDHKDHSEKSEHGSKDNSHGRKDK